MSIDQHDTELATVLRRSAVRARNMERAIGRRPDVLGFMKSGSINLAWLASRLEAAGIPHRSEHGYDLTLDPLCPESLAWCAKVLGPEVEP